MVIGSFYRADMSNSEERYIGRSSSRKDIIMETQEKDTSEVDFRELEYMSIKKRGLIGERETPYNPEFMKNGYSKAMIKRYENALPICDGKVILDVGCGLGWGVNIIKSRASEVYGIDYDQETIRYCKEKYPHDDVHFEVMDCRDLIFRKNTFDVVLLMEVIEHLTLEDGYKCIITPAIKYINYAA
jgi:2-polyprenyl-3-methyl-5-hydroxy-6-metoxy-1,4-benzoquinol methylase